MRVVRLISRSFLFFFFLFLLLLCAMQWNNNDNSRFVPPRNLLAYSTVCVCSSTSCELVYFQFLPPPPLPPVHVYSTCIRMQLRASSVHSNCISFRASMCVHLCTLIGQKLNIFHHAMKHWLLTSLFLAFNYKHGVACHWSFVSIFRLYYALW